MTQGLALGGSMILACMIGLWLLSLLKRDAGIVDAFWGPGFAILAWAYAALAETLSHRALLLASLVSVWGLRLAFHIALRSLGKPEDYRYANMRSAWGRRHWWVSLFAVFGFQGFLMLVISLPLLSAANSSSPLGFIDIAGAIVFVVGFSFEAVSDFQLNRFKNQPANKGTTLRTGLWRYTRHPNYFGDALLWWGFFLIGGAAAGAWWTALSPALMTVFLRMVSGVPLTEKRLRATRPDFAAYAAKTNAFFPWWPKTDLPPGRSTTTTAA